MPNLLLFLELAAIAIVFAGLPLAYLWSRRGYSFFSETQLGLSVYDF